MQSIILNLTRGFRRIAIPAAFAATCFWALGCGGEEKKEPTSEEIKKAQQQQMEMMRREMQNQ